MARDSIESRLGALSRSHDLLTRENWTSARLADIVQDALEPFVATGDRTQRYTVKGDNVRFPPKAALALGIAFNELATNAVKYGAFSNDGGSIDVSWRLHSPGNEKRLVLRWEEKGGPRVAQPDRKGFGSRVLEHGLARELDGVVGLDFKPTGLVCTIEVPSPASSA